MKKDRFYITKREKRCSGKIYVEQVDGYTDIIETSDGNTIPIGIYKTDNVYAAVEISTGIQFATSHCNYNLCLANAKFYADMIYALINRDDELIAESKQLINKANGRLF